MSRKEVSGESDMGMAGLVGQLCLQIAMMPWDGVTEHSHPAKELDSWTKSGCFKHWPKVYS